MVTTSGVGHHGDFSPGFIPSARDPAWDARMSADTSWASSDCACCRTVLPAPGLPGVVWYFGEGGGAASFMRDRLTGRMLGDVLML